jgi:hypothetical protein
MSSLPLRVPGKLLLILGVERSLVSVRALSPTHSATSENQDKLANSRLLGQVFGNRLNFSLRSGDQNDPIGLKTLPFAQPSRLFGSDRRLPIAGGDHIPPVPLAKSKLNQAALTRKHFDRQLTDVKGGVKRGHCGGVKVGQ